MTNENGEDLNKLVRDAFAATEPKLDEQDPDKAVIIDMVESVKQSFFRGRSERSRTDAIEKILEASIKGKDPQ